MSAEGREDRGATGSEGGGYGRGCPPSRWGRGLGKGLSLGEGPGECSQRTS